MHTSPSSNLRAAPAKPVPLEAAVIPRRRQLIIFAVGCTQALWPLGHSHAATFDHTHAIWTGLLKQHVFLLRGGQASQVNYAGLAQDRNRLTAYLSSISAVTEDVFLSFSLAQRQAFLINAYNAFTVELILSKYPDLTSIKELGSFLSSPWKPKWIFLLGRKVSLDDIEHDMLRKRDVHNDPRVHFAVNCASIGCPMLREEAFVASRIDNQLEEQTSRFMSDRTRNRFDEVVSRLQLSRIFDWYADDFKRDDRSFTSLQAFVGMYAESLSDSPSGRKQLRSGRFDIAFLNYDWSLNGAPR